MRGVVIEFYGFLTGYSPLTSKRYILRGIEMKRLAITIVVIAVTSNVLGGTYSGGAGSAADPYRISSDNDINELRVTSSDWGYHFIMTDDIDLSGTVYSKALFGPDDANGTSYVGTHFTGVFDGNNHVISGLTIDGAPDRDFLGLFGYIHLGAAEVKNLGVIDVNIVGGSDSEYVGALAGGVWGGSRITNCWSSGTVTGWKYTGGLIGCSWHTSNKITDCYSNINVTGLQNSMDTGGLLGYCDGTVSNCYAAGTVTAEDSDRIGGLIGRSSSAGNSIVGCHAHGDVIGIGDTDTIGGLIGSSSFTPITNCYATGNVHGDINLSNIVGGFAGSFWDTGLTDSYATGNVSGNNWVGGLLGDTQFSSISRCYSTGDINGISTKGGLIGNTNGTNIAESFWDTETSGTSDGVGDQNPDPASVTGKTTAEMKTAGTFLDAGWDLVETWGIEDNQTYPFLRLIYPVGDMDLDKDVDLIDFSHFANHWLDGVTP